ncbi:MAG: ABC transporter ATP-binding protein [Thiolinea sp.]
MNAITVDRASLVYRRYQHPRDALLEWLLRSERHEKFYALNNVSFQLQQGESLGIVGDNGAGKSTLLRLLAGNLQPVSGTCLVKGNRSALLELGSGLNPEFNGVENARVGLALRGLDNAAIARSLPEVLEFAELGEFAQQPVKNYSSGMVVRLVFAIAAVIKPDVLIVDEALSVGDQYFQKKSLDRMQEILHGGATLVFCSHNLYQLREICQQAIWLEQGKVRMAGDAQEVVDAYQDAVRSRFSREKTSCPIEVKQDKTEITTASPVLCEVTLQGATGSLDDLPRFMTYQRFVVAVSLDVAGFALDDVHVGIVIRRNDDVQCYGISTLHDGVTLETGEADSVGVRFVIESLPLLSGTYCLEVWLIDGSGLHVYDARERCCYFQVQQESQAQGVGMNWIPHRWEVGREVSHAVAPT